MSQSFLTKDFLAMDEEEIMMLYAVVHLRQGLAGAVEFKKATSAFLHRNKKLQSTWRRELKLGKAQLKARVENWSFDSTRIDQDFRDCLGRNVKYGNGGATTRIIGYDLENRRILTQTGSVYELE